MTTAKNLDSIMGIVPDWALLPAAAAIVPAGGLCRFRERKGK